MCNIPGVLWINNVLQGLVGTDVSLTWLTTVPTTLVPVPASVGTWSVLQTVCVLVKCSTLNQSKYHLLFSVISDVMVLSILVDACVTSFSCGFIKHELIFMPLVGDGGIYWNHCVHLSFCQSVWFYRLFITKLGMVVYYHEAECLEEKNVLLSSRSQSQRGLL